MPFPDRPEDSPLWAEDPQSDTSEPSVERARGFPFQYIPPATQFNWLFRTFGRWIDYFRRSAGGGFSSLPELIDALEPGEAAALVQPVIRPGTVLDKVVFANNFLIKAISVDGKRLYILTGTESPGVMALLRYDLLDESFASVDLALDGSYPVFMEANGDCVVVAGTSGTSDQVAAVYCLEADDLDERWMRDFVTAQAIIVVEGVCLSGTSVYASLNGGVGDHVTYLLDLVDEAQGSALPAANAVVRATNGREVAFSVGGETVSVRSADLSDELWQVSIAGAGQIRSMAMTPTELFVSTLSAGIKVFMVDYSVSPHVELAQNNGGIIADADSLGWYDLGGGPAFVGRDLYNLNHPIIPALPIPADDLDYNKQLIDLAADGVNYYVCGTDTSGDYAIWIVSKGQRPGIWRRLDPTDDDSWTRTLAAPI